MASKVRSELGTVLMKIRRAHRMFQHELAALAGVSARTYLRWENRHRLPTDAQLVRLVRAIHGLSPEHAKMLAASSGRSLEALGVVTRTPAFDPRRDAVEVAMYVAAEEMEIPARRVRAPLRKLLARLAQLGVTYEEASAVFASTSAPQKKGVVIDVSGTP